MIKKKQNDKLKEEPLDFMNPVDENPHLFNVLKQFPMLLL